VDDIGYHSYIYTEKEASKTWRKQSRGKEMGRKKLLDLHAALLPLLRPCGSAIPKVRKVPIYLSF